MFPAVRAPLSIKLHCASPSVQAGYLVEQAYYNNVMRDVIAKSLGEAQAAESDTKPFEYMPPDAVITLFAVIDPHSLPYQISVQDASSSINLLKVVWRTAPVCYRSCVSTTASVTSIRTSCVTHIHFHSANSFNAKESNKCEECPADPLCTVAGISSATLVLSGRSVYLAWSVRACRMLETWFVCTLQSLVEELRERLKVAEEQKTVDAHRPVIDIVQAMVRCKCIAPLPQLASPWSENLYSCANPYRPTLTTPSPAHA